MKHTMSLYADAFEQIRSGKKIREHRLNDEKRRKINVGDTIEFFKLPSQIECLLTMVKRLRQLQRLA